MENIKTIIVLGMHRSSTSMVARALHEKKEVCMGNNLLLGLPDNPKGHYEDKEFLHLNIDILNAAGGSWDNVPPHKKILEVAPKFENKIKKVIKKASIFAKKSGYQSWGFKDPRTVLTIDLYMPYLTNPQFIICYRKPKEIAKSLNKRNKMPIANGIKLTNTYNNRLNNFIKNWLMTT